MDIVISEEKGVRFLHFGSNWVQGAMRIARPYALELEYTREMMAPLLIRPESTWPKSALFIGLGVGALPKFLHKHRPSCRITVVEIASSVHRAAQMHFKLPEPSPYFQVEIACGADYMSQTQRTFDLIVVDGFDGNAKVGPLNSNAFYLNAKSRLSGQGMLVANLLSKQKDSEQCIQRFVNAFDGNALALAACQSGNVVGLGGAVDLFNQTEEELKHNAAILNEQTGLNLIKMVPKLKHANRQGAIKNDSRTNTNLV